jgi:tRNA nucleotidyltransferase (CCA-adding enzyme)
VEQSSIKQDLHRRDFTINTLAIRLDPPHWGELLDFYGGESDLHSRVLRVLHSLSFTDDPTRILRAARLETRLGFQLEPRSEQLIDNALPLLNRVSGDRIRHELEQLFDEQEPEKAVCRLEELGALHYLHPALRCDRWLVERIRFMREELSLQDWGLESEEWGFLHLALLVYRLKREQLEAFTTRLKIPRAEAVDLFQLPDLRAALRRVGRSRQPSHIDRLLRAFPPRLLAAAWAANRRSGLRSKLFRFQTEYRDVETILTGEDLKDMGLRPGPLFGRLLRALRTARLDGQLETREEEEALVRRLVEEEGKI